MTVLITGKKYGTAPHRISRILLVTALSFVASLASANSGAEEANVGVASEDFDDIDGTGRLLTDSVGWPDNANGELPMGGIFYGNAATGVGIQNAGIGVESSRRFRAERSGNIDTVRFNNRTLSDNDINQRCDAQGSGSMWCDCVDAGLDAYTCGYSLGSSYHVGNGGTLVVELRTSDENGLPSDVVLGKSESFIPMNNADNYYPKLKFNDSIPVSEGEIYHLVFTNLTPPGSCELTNVSPDRAASCPRNEGAMGLNGIRNVNAPSTTGRYGPFLGDSAGGNFYRRNVSSSWRQYENTLSWYEVGYADGVVTGESYSGIDAMRSARYVVEGSTRARQVFTVQDTSREVDGVWLNYGHTKSADGSGAAIVLKDSDGSVLALGTIASSQHCQNMVRDNAFNLSHWCQDWGYAAFDQAVSLLELSEYTVEISASSDAGFVLSAYREQNNNFRNRNSWNESRATISRDGGNTWEGWTETFFEERDLSLLFTLVGMPRQLR